MRRWLVTVGLALGAAFVQCAGDDGGIAGSAGPPKPPAPDASVDGDATTTSEPEQVLRCFPPADPHPSGSLDVTFGTASGLGGYAVVKDQPVYDDAGGFTAGIAVDGRGRIVMALTASRMSPTSVVSRMAIAAWTPDGDADRRFGEAGLRDLGIPSADDGASVAYAMTIDSADRIIVAGVTGADRPTLVRLGADGKPDPTFGSGGLRTPAVPRGWTGATLHTVATTPDGKIVASADLHELVNGASTRRTAALVGVHANLDELHVIGSPNGKESSTEALIVDDATATAVVTSDVAQSMFLAHFVPGAGAAPARFLEDAAAFPVVPFLPRALAPGAGGKVSLIGRSRRQTVLARIDLDGGALDPSFGDAGTTTLNIGDASASDADWPKIEFAPAALLRHSTGALYVVGSVVIYEEGSGPFSTGYVALARITDDGALDPTFGTGGVVVVSAPNDGRPHLFGGEDLALAEDRCRGRILVAGRSDRGGTVFAIWP